eukprot:TRINITY_DN2249_c1_g1_i2.p6 TRINITY_DN2249_c1_g1~~TRINITY_DN2249_c1_g1_i2.p6  ORF type:complete len:170 (-),score=0.66 TRINITY_DN2249_c1_g1_i2:1255-1710(-)
MLNVIQVINYYFGLGKQQITIWQYLRYCFRNLWTDFFCMQSFHNHDEQQQINYENCFLFCMPIANGLLVDILVLEIPFDNSLEYRQTQIKVDGLIFLGGGYNPICKKRMAERFLNQQIKDYFIVLGCRVPPIMNFVEYIYLLCEKTIEYLP